MSELASFLYDFISPVTGELASFTQIPKAEYGEVLMADENGYFSPSLSLIDAKIDINYLTKISEGMREASVIVQNPTDFFTKEQALSLLDNGYMVKGDDGIISTTSAIPPEFLSLPEGKLFIGNSNNIAEPSQIISIENLPPLYVTTITGLELPAGQIWRGTSSYRPEASDDLSRAEAELILLQARFLTGNFIMGSGLIQYSYPNAQYLSNILDQSLEGTILMKLGSRLKGATLTYNMVWKGNAEGFPQEAPYVSEERLQELVDEAQGFRDEAEGFAQEAEGFAQEAEISAGEAAASAGEATAAAAEATTAAAEVSAAVAGIGISVAAAAGSAFAAGVSAAAAGSYASDAEGYKEDAQEAATQSQISSNLSQTYYQLLLATGINELPCNGDVNLHGFKIVELGNPVEGWDAVNKFTLDAAIAGIEPDIGQLDGFVETTTTEDGVTHTVAGELAKLSLIPAGGDVSLENYRIKDLAYLPEDAGDAVSASFLWDLLNNRIDDMIFRTQLDPLILVPDSTQSFNYSNQQSSALFEIVTDFEPTSPSIPSNIKFDLLNFASKGYRSGVLTKNDNSKPTYLFSFIEPTGLDENATITSSPLFTYNENQNNEFKFYTKIQGVTPTSDSHLTTKAWVTSAISAAIPATGTVTLVGDVTGSGPVGTSITTSLSTQLTTSLATKTYVDNEIVSTRLDQLAVPTTSVNFNSQKIMNLATPTVSTDASNKGYIDGKTWTASSITNFSSSVNALITATRVDQLAIPTASVNFNSQKIINVATPTTASDGTNKSYVDGKTWSTSSITDFNSSVNALITSTKLDQLAVPTTSVNFNSQKIINVATPTVSTDASNKGYIDDKTWTASSITNFNSSVNTLIAATSISQLLSPNAIFNFGNQRLYNLGAPTDDQDATHKLWVTNYVASQMSGSNVTLAGDVSGTGALGTTITTTLNKNLSQISAPSADLNMNNKKITSLADPINNQDAVTKAFLSSYVTQQLGTFTPIICNGAGDDVIGNSSLGGKGYLLAIGRFVKIGRLVHIEATVAFAGSAYNPSDNVVLYFTGLPYGPNFTGIVNVPVYWTNLTNNNILNANMAVSLTSANARYLLNVVYQSNNTSASNPVVNIVRGNINQNQPTILSWSFSYTTSS